MNIIDKYIPTTQKSLFHKDICSHIKKWITNIIENDFDDKKKILFLYGPVGCGKTATIDILLKPFDIINIDSSEIRQEKSSDVINCIVGFNDITLSNIEKWNHSNKKNKPNIVLIDNIELCDKNIVSFVENIYIKHKINVPIVLICNNPKYKNIFITTKNCTYIEFNKPSLLELTKLVSDINIAEKLNLTKENIKAIVNKSEYDTRQTFYLLDQWKIHPINFDAFLESIGQKHADIDLTDKLLYLSDNTKAFDLPNTFLLGTSEPISLSNGIFQNYNNILEYYHSAGTDTLDFLETSSAILDNISLSNIFYTKIVEDQFWELYDSYTIHSCVVPSYHIKNYNKKRKIDTNDMVKNEKELYYRMNNFKDISYNYLNSFNEVKSIASNNIFSKKLSTLNEEDAIDKYNSYNIIKQDTSFYYNFIKLCISQIKVINDDFDKNKKGKNTTKAEKISLCKTITGPAESALDFMVKHIYTYKFFEVSIDDILLNKNKYFSDNGESFLKNKKTKEETPKKTTKKTKEETPKKTTKKTKEETPKKTTKKISDKTIIKNEEEKECTIFNDEQIINDIDKIDIRLFKRLLNIFSFIENSKVLKSHVEMAIKYKLFYKILNDVKAHKESFKKTRIESLIQNLDEIWDFAK